MSNASRSQPVIESFFGVDLGVFFVNKFGNYPATPLTEFNMTFFADEVVERCIGKNQPKSSWDRPEMSERRIAEFQKFGVTDCIET